MYVKLLDVRFIKRLMLVLTAVLSIASPLVAAPPGALSEFSVQVAREFRLQPIPGQPDPAPQSELLPGRERAEEKAISEITLDIRPPLERGQADLPVDYASAIFRDRPTIRYGADRLPLRSIVGTPITPEFCHQPLYFEEINLERYGRSRGVLQPAYSAAHFFGTLPAIPYKMVVERPKACLVYDYPYQAGRFAPRYHRLYPLRWDAAAVETAVILGLIAVIP